MTFLMSVQMAECADVFTDSLPCRPLVLTMVLVARCLVVTLVSYLSVASGFSVALPKNGVPAHSSALKMATWSDSKAVKDYQDFLQSGKQEVELAKDMPSVIIKPVGRMNELSAGLAEIGMGDDLILTPDEILPETMDGSAAYPIYITLPATQLAEFLDNLSQSYKDRIDDFVFFSGGLEYGNIEDVLKDRGYCRETMTQCLITGIRVTRLNRVQDISVKLGIDASGQDKWAGECTACGKWHGAIAGRLARSNIRCRTDFYREWRRFMWERNIYDAVFHLLGVVREDPTNIADVSNFFYDEVSDIVWDFSQLLRGWKAITLMYGFEERLFGVADATGGEHPCTLTDEMYPFIWGNSVFMESPKFVEYMLFAQEDKGFLQSIDMPKRDIDDFKTAMRRGNLRADGVI